MTRIRRAPPAYRQSSGPVAGTGRPTPAYDYYDTPVIIGVSQGKSWTGSVTIPYPAGVQPGDSVWAFGCLGPSLVNSHANYFNGFMGPWTPDPGGSPWPWADFDTPAGPLALTSTWPDDVVASVVSGTYAHEKRIVPWSNGFPVADDQTWGNGFPENYSNGNGAVRSILARTYTGVDDPVLTITSVPAAQVQYFMVCVRGGAGFGGYPYNHRCDARGPYIFGYTGSAGDPGGVGHGGAWHYGSSLSTSFLGGRFTLFATFTSLYATVEGSGYPQQFPDAVWSAPAISDFGSDPWSITYGPCDELASDAQGNKLWVSYAPEVPHDPNIDVLLHPLLEPVAPFHGIGASVTYSDNPHRTDRRWTYFGGALFEYVVDQSYSSESVAMSFFTAHTKASGALRATGAPSSENRRVRHFPEGTK